MFPVSSNKKPLIKGWQELATNDPAQLEAWAKEFGDRLAFWGIPCGPENDLLVLDVDAKGGGLVEIHNHHVPDTAWQATPSGGYHYLFKYPRDGEKYGNPVKMFPGLDARGAGGYILWYAKPGQHNLDFPRAEAPDWLKAKCRRVKDVPVDATGAPVKVDDDMAEAILEACIERVTEAPEGEGNNVLNVEAFRVGQLVAAGSIERGHAETLLFNAAVMRGRNPYEARATINSGLNGGGKKPMTSPFGEQAPEVPAFVPPPPPVAPVWTPAATTMEELLDHTSLRKPQLFENWASEDIQLTTADGGTGKTTLALYQAICMALGQPFLGFTCLQPGARTLFITGEDTEKKLKALLGAILRQMGLLEAGEENQKRVATVRDCVRIKKDADLCLVSRDRHNGWIHPNGDAIEKLKLAIDELKPKLIVFDPIAAFWGSESALNDMAKAVAKFAGTIAEYGNCGVEFINHMGKQSSQNRDTTQFAGRGGTGLPSHSRVSRVLYPVFDEEFEKLTGEPLADKQSAMMCVVNKFSDGSPLYNKPFLIVREGHLFSKRTMSDQKAREAQEKLTDVERVFQYVKEQREQNRYPSKKVIVAVHKTCGNPIPKTRTEEAISVLTYQGHMGDKLKVIQNPDETSEDKQVFIIVDEQGKEI